MKVERHDHRGGAEAAGKPTLDALISALEALDVPCHPNGQSDVRKAISNSLADLGWSGKVKVAPSLNITVTGMHGKTIVCVQMGNIGRYYADLLKIQTMFERGRVDGAILIVPTKDAAAKMASNLAQSDRICRELAVFRNIIHAPITVLGVGEQE